jgi:hypothetical protein
VSTGILFFFGFTVSGIAGFLPGTCENTAKGKSKNRSNRSLFICAFGADTKLSKESEKKTIWYYSFTHLIVRSVSC